MTTSCQNLKDSSPLGLSEGYDLNKPVVINLPSELDEISGIVFYKKDTSLFAIGDELGWLYKIYINHPKHIDKWKFSSGGDFEDIAMVDSNFYVLKSKGVLYQFKFFSSDSLFLAEYKFPAQGNEFETLYYDSSIKKLILVCKDCQADKKDAVSSYTFDPYTNSYGDSSYAINVKHLDDLLGEKRMKFKPSAAAIHPITNELYILSSVNKMLVIADKNGEPKTVFRLPSYYFKQPEGICFTPWGDLLISNEAANSGNATILIFKYNPRYKTQYKR